MIEYLMGLDGNALIKVVCISIIVGIGVGLVVVALVFWGLDAQSGPSTSLRDRRAKGRGQRAERRAQRAERKGQNTNY